MNHAYPKYGDADFNGGNQQAVLNCGRDGYIYMYICITGYGMYGI